ncbi:hypothetical protein JCM9279_002597 [Rhodotorula babjevae]
MDGAPRQRQPHLVASPVGAVPPSDPGDLEETRAALLGERYWMARSSIGEAQTGQAMQLDSEDESAPSPTRARASSSTMHDPRHPSPSFAAPRRRPIPSSPLADTSDADSSPLSLPALRKPAALPPVRLVSPISSSPPEPAFDTARQPLASTSRASSPSRSRSRSPTPRARAPPSSSLAGAASAPASPRPPTPPPVIPPDLDPPAPAGRSFRQRTAAQLAPYSTEHQRYAVSLLRNGWEGAVVRGLPRGHEEDGEDEVRRRKEAADKADKARRERLGGWLVEEEEEDEGDEEGGSTPRARGSATRRGTTTTGGRYERDGAWVSTVASGETEDEDDDLELDGDDLLEREARRRDRMRRAVDAAMGDDGSSRARKRKHSPHRHGPSRLDDPRYLANGGPASRRRRRRSGSTGAPAKRSGSSRPFADDHDRDDADDSRSSPGSDSSRASGSEESDSLPAPHELGTTRPARRKHKRKRTSAPQPHRRALGSADGARCPRTGSGRAESAPPSSSPARTSRKRSSGHGRGHRHGERRRDGEGKGKGSGRRGRAGSEPARDGFAVRRRPDGMAMPAGSLHGRAGRGGVGEREREEDWEGELRALDSGTDGASGSGSETERGGRRRRHGGDSDDSPSASRSSSAPALDRNRDGDEPSSDVSVTAPAPRLEVRGKRRRALGAMMPAVFLKKAVADLELMKRERRARRAGGALGSGSDAELDGDDESDELNSGDEEALERERERRRRARARVRVRRLDGDDHDARPSLLGADVFTDESGSAPERSDDDDDAHDDEADAVASWLDSFAPRSRKGRAGGAAAGGGADEDIVDRFLRRARRPPRGQAQRQPSKKKGGAGGAGRAGGGEGKGTPARAQSGPAGAGRGDKQQRGVLRDSGNYVAGYRPLDGPAAPAWQRRPRQVALDTDEAVFAFVGLRNEPHLDDPQDADVVVVGPPRRPAASRPAGAGPADFGIPLVPRALDARVGEPDGEVWASFGRFSHDFDLHRLPAGVRFAGPDSFVRNGYLFSLVDVSALPQGPFAADVFGCRLVSSMAADEVDALVPTMCDGAHDALATSLAAADGATSPLVEVGSALRFLGHWTSTQVARPAEDDALARLGTAILVHLERLETRLNSLPLPDDPAARAFRLRRIVLSWHVIDLAARLRKECGDSVVDSARLRRLVAVLVRRLLQHGVDRTTRTLKAARAPDALVADVTVEAWLGLVSLALSDGGSAGLSESELWTIVLDETRATLAGTKAERGPAGGEVISYTAMALCAISQFSPSGISSSKPRLAAHWPALLVTLEAIQPAALAQPDHTLSSTAVARRDRYLWTLFARCLVFVERWAWSVDIRDELLPRLFDLLNARRLADLTTETAGDFPPFLQDLALFDKKLELDPKRDTAFVILLKLVMAAAATLPSSTDAEKRRRGAQLTRLFLRLSPMASSAWCKQSVELTSRGPSVLVNHYSLHLAFAALLPSAAPQRIEQAARLIAFGNVDDEARKTCIRAALYFALIARRHQLALGPVVEWLADITSTLKSEYAAVERERRKDERLQRRGGGGGTGAGGGGSSARDGTRGDPLWTRALMITMVLRSVQVVTRSRRPGQDQAMVDFPDLALLHPAWTSQLLDSPLALDPMIGREAIRTIECFFDVRRAALPRPSAPQAAAAGHGESQDDFGMLDDLDFDDPALNAMLGIDGGSGVADSQQQREDELKAKDKAFAELLRTTIAPAFFRLVSNIFVDQQASGPTVVDRVSYAQTAVECWTRCLSIAVENRVADWRPYLQYGDQSWKRLSDPVGRRDIGLFLVIQILKHDPSVYTAFADDVVEILFESIVARRLTSQHVLLEQLLNADEHEHLGTVSPLLDGLPFARSTETGRIQVEQLDLLDKRLDVLAILFRNAARLVLASTAGQPGSAPLSTAQLLHRPTARPNMPRGTVMNLLRSMLAAMKDNLTAIHDESSRSGYASFVRLVLTALTSAGSEASPGRGAGGPRAGVKKGPFDEAALPDVRALRNAVA